MQRLGIYNKAPSKKKEYEAKPYQQMTHPGERVQIDVKYVPAKSLTKEVIEKIKKDFIIIKYFVVLKTLKID